MVAADGSQDTFTVYQYGGPGNPGTDQTLETVYAGLDATGPVVETDSYSYNLQDKMSGSVVTTYDSSGNPTATTSGYTYDDDGDRVSQTVNGATTFYLVDANNLTGYSQVLQAEQASGGQSAGGQPVGSLSVTTTYVLGDVVLAQQSPGQAGGSPLYFITDGHGSTRLVLDMTGQQPALPLDGGGSGVGAGRSRFAYDAYGNALSFAPSQAVTSVLYSGQLFDNSTGLQYLRARYYNPISGQFTRRDRAPGHLGSPASLNAMSYCWSSPVMSFDPSGCALVDFALDSVLETVVTASISGLVSGLVSSWLGGSFVNGFERGFVSGLIASAGPKLIGGPAMLWSALGAGTTNGVFDLANNKGLKYAALDAVTSAGGALVFRGAGELIGLDEPPWSTVWNGVTNGVVVGLSRKGADYILGQYQGAEQTPTYNRLKNIENPRGQPGNPGPEGKGQP